MSTSSRTVRVFLSSTFRDFAEERDLLVRKVFPELRRKCRERQVELVDVDLRWGITEEEAQQGKVLPICLAEIERSRPFFMGFIGERYGWIPEQEKYDLSLIMEQPWLDEHRGGKSVTELEMLHGVLNNPAMEDRAFFYFREPAWSQKKGGAYLSEGSAEKEKLEALKDRIRQSGFPVVEDYPTPEALAERVKEDLWKLIDEAFPESEVPDALAQERMRHEAFAASRLGLYIGGERYFESLDAAMAEDPCKPVLVCGASGGGKSALLANWAQKFASSHPEAIVLTHFLGTGADAAHPVSMAIRIIREISRMTGEEFVLEGDPRKALRMFGEWLEKAGSFARERGGVFVLVLDALDKMTEHRDLDWWPRKLPEGVAMVASCLDGDVRDTVARRMEWTEVRVSPLEPMDCERFMEDHLAKYRKALTPEQKALILAQPLCGNPLFLRTLLEELRVFGVHEELNRRLQHYLASETIDDLFEKVLDRIESDNTPESVRAALEVLWAAKESFAEDELLTVSQLPPAVWAPIHIALDESLIGAGGRIAFSHDYLRKAVEDRYLNSEVARQSIQKRMAEFCVQAMAGGRKEISRYVRRHAVEHFLEVEDWDNATAALSDLEFIEARAIAQELPGLLTDYSEAVELLPEGEKERQTEAALQAELDRYAKEMVEYSATWSRIRDGSWQAEPPLPRPVPQVRLWTEEEITAERKRMAVAPNRLDILKAFRIFVATNSAPLQNFSAQEGFTANLAINDAPAGPVHEEGKKKLQPLKCIKLIKQFAPGEIYNPLPACEAVFEGHRRLVNSIVLSPDGRRIISGSYDNTLRVWDFETGECLMVLEGHTNLVTSLALSPDGQLVVSGSSDDTLRIWNMETGMCKNILQGHTSSVKSFVLNLDKKIVISGSYDNTARIWDAETGETLKVLKGHTGGINSLILSTDGLRLVSGSYDNTLRIWNMETGMCIKVLVGHTGGVNSLVLSPDGNRVVSASDDNTLRIWDVDTGECLKIIEGHSDPITSLVLCADGRRVVSGSNDKTLRIWDVQTGKCLKILKGHTDRIGSLVLSADGRFVVSGSDDKTLRIWDVQTGKCLKVLESHSSAVNSIALTVDGRRVISGDFDTLLIWNIESGVCLKALESHSDSVISLVLSTNGRLVISGSDDNTLRLWDCETGECLKVLEGHTNLVTSFVLSADGRRIVSGSNDKTLRIWDVQTGKCLKILDGHTNRILSLVLSGNAKGIVSGSGDKTLRIWDIETGKCLRILEGHSDSVTSLVLSADGHRIISGSVDKTLRVWDVDTGECLKILQGHSDSITSLVLSADGRRVVSGSDDNTLRLWDCETGECLKIFAGHTNLVEAMRNRATNNFVRSIVWNWDGRLFVSRSRYTLRLWDVETSECLKDLQGHVRQVNSLVISADGRQAVSAGYDNTLRFWDVKTGLCRGVFFRYGISHMAFHSGVGKLVLGFSTGCVEFYNLENLPFSPLITTAHREIISEDLPAGPVTARPPCCGQQISIPPSIADRIEYWNYEGGEGGYTENALLLDCPNCGTPLRMNPFFVDVKTAGT
jgi:WD40 repeat protein